jgi:hypothetical protein
MQDWQLRVIEERDQLVDRLEKLVIFLAKPSRHVLSHEAYGLLVAQQLVMHSYLSVLDRRIALWKEPE